jgi:hypothetical protein
MRKQRHSGIMVPPHSPSKDHSFLEINAIHIPMAQSHLVDLASLTARCIVSNCHVRKVSFEYRWSGAGVAAQRPKPHLWSFRKLSSFPPGFHSLQITLICASEQPCLT